MERRVIVITGPTGSGKSALALALAERHRGTVINADAMQTYDAFPILTAQPSEAERRRVPHALYGVLPLSETLSAARWRALADIEIERCFAAGHTPILCGGSGLYLRTLM
jgi:tRNA dimethylallyltransferase